MFLFLRFVLTLYFAARLFPSCRATLCIMGFFGSMFINLMRNNLSVGIVCMTIDPEDTTTGNDTSQNSSIHQKSWVSVMFPDYRRSRGHTFLNDEPDDCPGELSSDGFGEVRCSFLYVDNGSFEFYL